MARPKVILFDVNETLLDLQPMKEAITKLLGGGPEIARLWFTTLLQHSQVMTLADRFADFSEIAAACLRMVAKNQGVDLSEDAAQKAVAPMRSLPPHPDVVVALEHLRDAGYRLAPLTNSSKAAVADQMKNAGLTDFFEVLLSVEEGIADPPSTAGLHAARKRPFTDRPAFKPALGRSAVVSRTEELRSMQSAWGSDRCPAKA